jgi:hypothetical protein
LLPIRSEVLAKPPLVLAAKFWLSGVTREYKLIGYPLQQQFDFNK